MSHGLSCMCPVNEQCCSYAGDHPLHLHPCSVFKQQHARSVTFVKLTNTDILTAGSDGRICHYHWRAQTHSPSGHQPYSQDAASDHHQHIQHSGPPDTHRQNKDSSSDMHQHSDLAPGFKGAEADEDGRGWNSAGSSSMDQHSNLDQGGESAGNHTDGLVWEGADGNREALQLQCVAEERVPNITTVQDVMEVPDIKEQLVCGFQVWGCSLVLPLLGCALKLVYCLSHVVSEPLLSSRKETTCNGYAMCICNDGDGVCS